MLENIVVEAMLCKQKHDSHNIFRCRWDGHPASMDTWELESKISTFEHIEEDPMGAFRLRQQGMTVTEARVLTRGKKERKPCTPKKLFQTKGGRVVVMVKHGDGETSTLDIPKVVPDRRIVVKKKRRIENNKEKK